MFDVMPSRRRGIGAGNDACHAFDHERRGVLQSLSFTKVTLLEVPVTAPKRAVACRDIKLATIDKLRNSKP